MQKDFSKIRPFDLEAAQAGGKVCIKICGDDCDYDEGKYIIGPDVGGEMVAIEWDGLDGLYGLMFGYTSNLGMAPLFWLEGSPIYKGDIIYYRKDYGIEFKTNRAEVICMVVEAKGLYVQVKTPDYGVCTELMENMTIKNPATIRKGFVIIFHCGDVCSVLFNTYEDAEAHIDKKFHPHELTKCSIVPVEWGV